MTDLLPVDAIDEAAGEPLCRTSFRCARPAGSPYHIHDEAIEGPPGHGPYWSCHPFQPGEVPATSPLLALCPVCGAAVMARLRTSWQRLVESGEVIPIIGCGNPWHYAGMG